MLFTHNGETLDSDLLQFCPKQKAYVKLLEDEIETLRFKLQEQIRETREKILDERR